MNASFFLFLPPSNCSLESSTLSWVYEDINNELKLAQGRLSDAATASLQKDITIVVLGENVLFLTAEVPGKNLQRVQQAIPYVLEDKVIDDVDELYFAIKKQNSDSLDNKYNVSIINKNYFKSVTEQLENAEIYADTMIADYFLLKDDGNCLFDGTKLVYNDEEIKFSSLLDSSIKLDADIELKLINCDKTTSKNTLLSKFVENNNIVEEKCELHPLLYLVKNRSDYNINLLQGVYKKKKDWSQAGKTWMPVSALLGVWLIIQTGIFVFDYIDLSKKSKLINLEITKIYKQTFPKSRRIIDAKAQMQQKLSSFKKRKGQNGRSFTEMLSNSASVFSKTKGLEIKSLRYYDGKINLEIQVSSLQALDKLSEQLNKEKGYQVEVQNASSGKDTVTARLQIVGADS